MASTDDTPSGNPPTSPAEFALETLERACLELGYGFRARREVLRGLSEAQRDAGLAREADHARDAKHLAAEAETILRALVGFRSDREVAISQPTVGGLVRYRRLGVLATAIAALAAAAAGLIRAMKGLP